jgi:hypothetical protein
MLASIVALRVCVALLGLGVFASGIGDMARRRPVHEDHRFSVTGVFLISSGASLLVEALLFIGAFGLISGVMLVCAGAASALGFTNEDA